MALTINNTPGDAAANAYASIAEADTYVEQIIHEVNWSSLTDDQKTSLIIWATRLIDESYDWSGYKTFEDGALDWPRTAVYDKNYVEVDSETIPQFLINATAELARLLYVEDRTQPSDPQVRSQKADVLEQSFFEQPYWLEEGAIPDSVDSILRWYGKYVGAGGAVVIRS